MTINENKIGYKNTKVGWIPLEWEVELLGEIGEFKKGKGISKSQLVDKGIPAVRYGELYTKHNIIIKKFYSFISNELANSSKPLIKNDILFASSGETLDDIGKCATYQGELNAFVGGDIIILSPKSNFDSFYLSSLLNSNFILRERRKLGQGHSVVHIYASSLKHLQIPIPPLPEQKKIAEILSTWDTAIEKTQTLVHKLKTRKKALMQQLLSGNKRLNGFSGAWENVVLGDISTLTSSKRIYLSDYVDKGIPFYRGKEISELKKGISIKNLLYIKEDVYLDFKKKYGIPVKNDLLITAVGTLGNVYRIPNNKPFYFKDGNLIWIKNVSQNSSFLEYLLNFEYKIIYRSAIGSSQKALTIIGLNKIKLTIPPLPEQKAIAKILSQADQEIELQEQYLDKLEIQKKGLMQVLLTGAVRTIVN